MHSLMAFLTLVMVVGNSYLQLRFLTFAGASRGRLFIHFFALATPALILGLMLINLCWLIVPGWNANVWNDNTTIRFMAWSGAVIVAGVLVFSLVQRVLPSILVRRYPKTADPALISLIHRLSSRFGIPCPTLRVYDSAYPVAALYGVRHIGGQTLLLSSWVISNLDEDEREAVLAHELAHLRRRDDLVIWVAQILRDVSFYIPAVRRIWMRLQLQIELACDELADKITGQRLALASALCKVQHQTLRMRAKPRWTFASGLLGAFSNLDDFKERASYLTGGAEEATTKEMPTIADFSPESLTYISTLKMLLMVSSLHFMCCQTVHEYQAVVGAVFVLSGLFLALMFVLSGRVRLHG